MLGRAIRAFLTTVIVSLMLTSCSAFFPSQPIPAGLYVRSSGDVFDLLFCVVAVINELSVQRRNTVSGDDDAEVIEEKVVWETGPRRALSLGQFASDPSVPDLSALKVGDDLYVGISGTRQGEEFYR